MKRTLKADVSRQFETALQSSRQASYLLRLYITGATPRSTQAIQNIKRICDEHLLGRYQLEVVDVFQRPVLAKGEQIIAAPTLIKLLPLPLRRFIGDMSNTDKILLGLDLLPRADYSSNPPTLSVREGPDPPSD
ncbi:MAG: circadian clock KaiB family protein [Verrucomicrobiota bacterium]